MHSDHCGANALIAAETSCDIIVPQASLYDVQDWDSEALSHSATGQDCARFGATSGLRPGETFVAGGLEWQALAAPGHDDKSLIFFAPVERLLISADALWENGFGIIFPEVAGQSGFAEQADILDLIESLDARVVLPGHGPLFTDVEGALGRAKSRLKALLDKPGRHARSAIKVLVKFALLDQEQVHIERFSEHEFHTTTMLACARQLGEPLPGLLRQALHELSTMGAARIDGEYAFNHD